MGKIPILTKEQEIILGEITKISFFKKNFYFTGGTALSTFYLHHRLSEDLDFFSEKKFDNQIILTLMQELSKKLKFEIQSNFNEVVYIFNLKFNNGAKLKVDFGYYPYKKIVDERLIFEDFKLDSLRDIATNKLLTISQRTDIKDFVDLYFLLDEFTIWDLIDGVKFKFRIKIEPFIIAGDFLKIEGFEVLPKMIKPLKLAELKDFFRDKAKKLGRVAIE